MENTFLPLIFRMRYISRWSLMYNTEKEDLMQHAAECAFLTHFLATIGNRVFGKQYDAERLAVHALFHDASEVLTGDLPTPVKYYNPEISTAYKSLEAVAASRLISYLPEDLRPDYEQAFGADGEESARIIKAADKLSALIKCIEEEKMGNNEFRDAAKSLRDALSGYHMPEVSCFMEEFLPSFSMSLDEQSDTGDD